MTGMDLALAVFFTCYGLLLAALLAAFAWSLRDLGAERLAVTHTDDYRWYVAEMRRRGDAALRGEVDTAELPEPVQEALEEMWAQAPWIEERQA